MKPRSEFVLIHGDLFLAKAKAPFVLSGYSYSGALEFDPPSDRVKCHECGHAFTDLSKHVRAHSMSTRTYRIRHGLASTTKLCGRREALRNSLDEARAARIKKTANEMNAIRERAYAAGRERPWKRGVSQETLNIRGTCREQMLSRLRELAKRFGRTPTHKEIQSWGLSIGSLCNVFGSVHEAIRLAGLENRTRQDHPLAAARAAAQ